MVPYIYIYIFANLDILGLCNENFGSEILLKFPKQLQIKLKGNINIF